MKKKKIDVSDNLLWNLMFVTLPIFIGGFVTVGSFFLFLKLYGLIFRLFFSGMLGSAVAQYIFFLEIFLLKKMKAPKENK